MDSGKNNNKRFNKKEWREKKYSNKYKVKQWEDRRQKAVMRNYFKELAKDKSNNKINTNNTHLQTKKKMSAYQAAQNEFRRLKEEKEKQLNETKRRKEEINEALKKYRKEKFDKFKKLSKKTKRGQPVMKDRMQILYEKIQSSI